MQNRNGLGLGVLTWPGAMRASVFAEPGSPAGWPSRLFRRRAATSEALRWRADNGSKLPRANLFLAEARTISALRRATPRLVFADGSSHIVISLKRSASA